MRDTPVYSAVCGLLALGLAACATPASGPYADLGYVRVRPGSTLALHAPLRVPANQAHASIQAVGSGEMDPFCELEISTVSESPQTVEPDVFEIWRVGRSISPSSDWGMGEPLQAAALDLGPGAGPGTRVYSGVGIGIGLGGGYGGGWAGRTPPTQLFYKTRFWLRSAKQPGVRQLTCQWDQMTASGAAFARHLTVAEIRAALGSTFTLTLAGESGPGP